ncbi:Reticulocyte-binding protein 2 homolog a [Durusdinium trenchii]|uniref:Reticulocyte-binding protein 2 homolog a n=1 Tax=Durusdinium trenchii TaxID=1381693 RepID=A0ABP0PZI1_9DINO
MARQLICCLVLMLLTPGVIGAVTLGAFGADDLVKQLRSSIFVETAFLEERPPVTRCSSLDGPSCLHLMLDSQVSLDGPGVIPERLLHDLGAAEGMDFVTPEYFTLEELVRMGQATQSRSSAEALLVGDEAKDYLLSGRNKTSVGLLHFAGAALDRRLPLTFSLGLPKDLVATWDGRWIARDGSTKHVASLPSPDGELPVLSQNAGLVRKPGGGSLQLSVSAELAGSLGYLRFSRPVTVRSLFVHWVADRNAPRAIVAGRLGLQNMWNSHLDPQQLESVEGWVDIAGNPLAQVDELVFMAAKGLQISAVQIASTEGTEEEERTVLMLQPFESPTQQNETDESQPQPQPHFIASLQRLRADAAPFVATLQEVVDHNLRLRMLAPSRALGGVRGDQIPGLLSIPSSDNGARLTEEALSFKLAASQNEVLFSRGFLTDIAANDARNMIAGFSKVPEGVLPEDLRRQLTTESPELAETVLQHVRRGGWKRSTPSTLPQEGSEDAVKKYMTAKRQQMQLDLLAADVVMSPLVLPFELVVAGLLWSLAVVLLLGGASAVAVWDCAQLIKTKRIQWHRQKGLEDAAAACEPSKDSDALVKDLSQVEGPADCSVEAEKPVTVEDLQLRMEELQAKHQEELREKDLKLEEMQKELEEKKAEGLELWEDAKKQRREANRLQSFAISATNSLRKMQREVNRLQKVIAQQKTKYTELQESQRARREGLLLRELDLSNREAEVSQLAQAEQEELAQLREWLSAPSSGAKDEHRQIAGLRDEVKEWKSTYKKDKASWMRAICELTKQRDQHVARADVLAKQLGQWREIFQETDLLELEHQDWEQDELGTKQDESCQNSPQVFYISSPRSEARSSSD